MRYNCINAVAIYTRFARMRYDINPRIVPKAYRAAGISYCNAISRKFERIYIAD